jgi:ribose transport system permease protein
MNSTVGRLFSTYGMFVVLLGLCALFSVLTVEDQFPEGNKAAESLFAKMQSDGDKQLPVLIVTKKNAAGDELAEALTGLLESDGWTVIGSVRGDPPDVRVALKKQADSGGKLGIIACDNLTVKWGVVEKASANFPSLGTVRAMEAPSYRWPNFLKRDNLRNITSQISVIAILAIGMTLVIITAGIDLSVGSLIALSAVTCTMLIRDHAGGFEANLGGVLLCCAAAIAVCSAMGLFSGVMVTFAGVPSFIVTLAIMLVAKGMAGVLSKSASINQVPDNFDWLGVGTTAGIPNSVILMMILYIIAHIVMSYTAFGRYVYALGGNAEAARLSGVPIKVVNLAVYTLCGALAGLGGVLMASQLKSGAMTYGVMYELYVIAAVVVGGTSLMGGEGKIFGTLIGAFIIAVIRNGMNLVGLEEFQQMIVLGMVILAAVLLDSNKHHVGNVLKRGNGGDAAEAEPEAQAA